MKLSALKARLDCLLNNHGDLEVRFEVDRSIGWELERDADGGITLDESGSVIISVMPVTHGR